MKLALIHDYLNEFGGAERVLLALSEIWPRAPIYTAFYKKGSPAWQRFKDKDVRVSFAQKIPFFPGKLHSPLRFLAPKIWGSVAQELKDYDVVISSASWYVTKGFGVPIEICYCHTPPRWLYGYPTSVEWQKYWPVKVYGLVVGHFMRLYDYEAAQKVTYFIANSDNVKKRIAKFYRRDSQVIYPPVDLGSSNQLLASSRKKDYYLVVSRIVGGKGLQLAVKTAVKHGLKLKVVGEAAGWGREFERLQKGVSRQARDKIKFMGRVDDEKLVKLYSQAKAFLALATDEDFGMTPVEAMACGTGVVAYNGGGYRETILPGKTGVLFDNYSVEGLWQALKRFNNLNYLSVRKNCLDQARKFSKARFKREMKEFVEEKVKKA
ncbi:MAG: Glycosyl transferase group 1 [Candidatus Beckwithbacteria bacterium GW2011_GWB1_47_15]|uniref:Glycosyl transferase group 1 n=1 Tax=Candidatus Beckwithbacteria bacterium GW2011_GWB1_47_15 TaxID=1618371 RepID=A0A0G1RV70_9BACT|nr:MAG: glycosyl transferase group 1 [Candidatus Beckwithbacteria bacterium GW2011_GWC1_49_16]KKU35509.1 MAG: Glycosyl transferase group 1 [Candidatus Beckwithbacteria bacterium GW2011_GWA1_46_30]KKU61184.1 MAG: Glycosyl transferase group 1 [Candidatus Beckwithbacteria bacterium GW2011_GWB1_47_15]KKU72023.1 MAG: Glycosyl transferase group 1 [Candidatus Beckwithbacteria bacterium GW2011_GWA2_47_25]KKW03261.1 MAG: Glycosyl transferase group 1 [Candidatus Beckwithbacteria bacterium GW2011_GWC2_49_